MFPFLLEALAPVMNAFAAVAAQAARDTDGLPAGSPFFSLPLRDISQSAVAPTALAVAVAGNFSGALLLFMLTLSRTFLLLNKIRSAPAPTTESCTGVRFATSSTFATPCHPMRLTLRTPCSRR